MERKWKHGEWIGIPILIIVFFIGFGIGRIGKKVEVRVEKKIEKVKGDPFLNLALPKGKLKERVETFANIIGETLYTETGAFQRGYEQGYCAGRED